MVVKEKPIDGACLFQWAACFLLVSALACQSNTSSDSSANTTPDAVGLRFNAVADFGATPNALRVAQAVQSLVIQQCSQLSQAVLQDQPHFADGLDCDDDGGIVAHITPSAYAVAFKRISLIPSDVEGEDAPQVDFVADTETLGASHVVTFSSADALKTIITIDPQALTAGTYIGIESELYYYQMMFSIAGIVRHVRIYMSDDDFPAEASDRSGLGPHHQGDITLVDDSGEELGWIDDTWGQGGFLSVRSGNDADGATNGAGGVDSQTGHARGFFGDSTLWDDDASQQGAAQDIFIMSNDFATPLVIPDPTLLTSLITITATFSTSDTFFYEDFAPQGTGFSPGAGGEASSEGAAWAPLAPSIAITAR